VTAHPHQVEGAQVLKAEGIARRPCRLVIGHSLAYRTNNEHVNEVREFTGHAAFRRVPESWEF
jgi:hypothetical protein